MDDPTVPSIPPKPSHPKSLATPDWNSTWGSSNLYQQGNRGDYAQLRGPPCDDESCTERSTVEHTRKGFRVFILSNIYVPLVRVSQTCTTVVSTTILAFSIC